MKESVERLGIAHLFIDATRSIEEIHEAILAYIRH
jgi:hypothetical protein